jgi:hypothetical protein
MEYVPGVSLEQRLDRGGALHLHDVLGIGAQTAAGLAAAHARGLIHRDVKPANILLEHGLGRVKLTDFGLARAVDDASLTQSGVIPGTPMYMAPEQARGTALDHRADLFSLGSVLYTLCTGRPPFRAPTSHAVLLRVCEDTPHPIRDLNPEVPEWLVEIIETLHAKDPAARFQSAAEVSELLGQHLAHLRNPSAVPPPKPIRARRGRRSTGRWSQAVLGLVALGCTAAVVLGWYVLHENGPSGGDGQPPGRKAEKDPAAAPVAQGPRVQLTNGQAPRVRGRLTFRVDFSFVQGDPSAATRYVWVVRSGRQTFVEHPLEPAHMARQGTLSAGPDLTVPPGGFREPIETYLVAEKLVPGRLGPQREVVSNTLILTP